MDPTRRAHPADDPPLILRRAAAGIGIGGAGFVARPGQLFGSTDGRPRRRPKMIAACRDSRIFRARAKRVIYMFMNGAPSQLELFDYKPKLEELPRPGPARVGAQGAADHDHDLGPEHGSRSRRRCSNSASTAERAPGSANCCRTPPRSSTTSPHQAREYRGDQSRPGLHVRHHRLPASRPAQHRRLGLATGWAARTQELPAFVVMHLAWHAAGPRPAALRPRCGVAASCPRAIKA